MYDIQEESPDHFMDEIWDQLYYDAFCNTRKINTNNLTILDRPFEGLSIQLTARLASD